MRERRYPAGPSALRAMRGLRALGGGGAGANLAGVPIFLGDMVRRYGGIVHWSIAGQHFFLLDEPALIEDFLVFKERDFLRGRGVQRLKRILGDGLLSSEEPLHLRQRQLMQPAFHRERITGYGRQMVAATAGHIARWQAGTTLDIHAEMTDLTLAIAAQTLFSADVGRDAETIRAALSTVMQAFPTSLSRFSELLDLFPMLPVTRNFLSARAALDGVIYGMIAARRGGTGSAAEPDDLLAMLLAARDGAEVMDDRQVRDEALTLFMAGHETTANALTWAWYLLARHPHVAERLAREVDDVLGGRLPEPDDVPRLRYTRDVLSETLRLYPPAWIVGRRAMRATSIGNQAVPAGSVVLASQFVTHRNYRYWSEPDAFRPERWSTDGPPHRFAFFPFGGGSRRCIGEAFAWMEGVLLLATIAQRFALAPADPSAADVDVDPLITLRPRSAIRLRIAAREASRFEVAG